MQEYTQASAYKHLLEVIQNILYSIQPESEILRKYQSLKKAVLNKITNPSLSDLSEQFSNQLIISYKLFVEKIFQAWTSFQSQIQIQTQFDPQLSISKLAQSKIEQFIQDIQQISLQVSNIINQLKQIPLNQTKFNHKKSIKNHQLKFQNSQITTLQNHAEHLNRKLDNLQLMVEVHKKMHQIIIRASLNEKDKLQRQAQLNYKIQLYQQKIKQNQINQQSFNQIKKSIQQYQLTEQSLNRYKMISRKFMKVIFE